MTLRVFRQLAKMIWRMSSRLLEPKSTSELLPKIDQISTGNQNQTVGNVENSVVVGDVGVLYIGTYERPITGTPFQVPYRPDYFVERPEHYKKLRQICYRLKPIGQGD